MLPPPRAATQALHADAPHPATSPNAPITPSLSLSSTFRTPHPAGAHGGNLEALLAESGLQAPAAHVYSRYTDETRCRLEAVLSGLLGGEAVSYSSGLTAAYAALTHYAPSTLAIRGGYHGCHSTIELWKRSHPDLKVIDLDAEYPAPEEMGEKAEGKGEEAKKEGAWRGGLLVWLETPLNPTGEARDIETYAKRAHAANGHLLVDSTFAPPPLQAPFEHGADCVMHSATKYLGGHSDLLAGVLAVKSKAEFTSLFWDRTYIGSPPGSMESWLLLRSLRSLSVRVSAQSTSALRLVEWLHSLSPAGPQPTEERDVKLKQQGVVKRVWHASLQPRTDADREGKRHEEHSAWDPRSQMKGWNACFAFRVSSEKIARFLPHATQYFIPATSLGGVESLLEWRKGADPNEEPGLIRISVGLEDPEDLIADLRDALEALLRGERLELPTAPGAGRA